MPAGSTPLLRGSIKLLALTTPVSGQRRNRLGASRDSKNMSAETHSVRPTDSLFFALFPDVRTAKHIESVTRTLCAEHRILGKPPAQQRLHVTLHHLGKFRGLPSHAVVAARQAAAEVTLPPFDLVFDHVTSFERRNARNRPIVLGTQQKTPALAALYQTLGAALMRHTEFGCKFIPAFTPHLTLLYGDRHVAQDIEPVKWTVREFVLIHSLLGRTRYIRLGRWSLRG